MIQYKERIIQYSPGRTGSTLLTNILYGLFYDYKPVCFVKNISEKDLDEHFIIKTHNIPSFVNSNYNLFFIASERKEINQLVEHRYRNSNNFLIFSYEDELLETNTKSILAIVTQIKNKLQKFLPKHISDNMKLDRSVKRITDMNIFYESIKDRPFSYYDEYYKIHGSHKDRKRIW